MIFNTSLQMKNQNLQIGRNTIFVFVQLNIWNHN